VKFIHFLRKEDEMDDIDNYFKKLEQRFNSQQITVTVFVESENKVGNENENYQIKKIAKVNSGGLEKLVSSSEIAEMVKEEILKKFE
jgi:hypothetical protein